MEKEADRLVMQRDYEKATPLLQELAARFGDTTSPQLLRKLERILYHQRLLWKNRRIKSGICFRSE